jgi:hypothetical protein
MSEPQAIIIGSLALFGAGTALGIVVYYINEWIQDRYGR